MGSLLVITGPPGSGKTSIAGLLSQEFERSVVVEGDAFFRFLARGSIPPWLPASHVQNDVVISASAAAASEFVSGRYFTIYEGIVGPWYLETFAELVGLEEFDYVVLMPSEDVCLARIANRGASANIGVKAAQHMYREFASSPTATHHVMRLGSESKEEVKNQVLAGMRVGKFRFQVTD